MGTPEGGEQEKDKRCLLALALDDFRLKYPAITRITLSNRWPPGAPPSAPPATGNPEACECAGPVPGHGMRDQFPGPGPSLTRMSMPVSALRYRKSVSGPSDP